MRAVADAVTLARAAGPLTHVSGSSPPVLILYGERAGLMSQEQGLAMHEAPLSVGADSALLLIAGASHVDPAFHKPAVVDAVTAFFEAVLT
jgi:pimeloyl-ACP methyl ester carboxylesterase